MTEQDVATAAEPAAPEQTAFVEVAFKGNRREFFHWRLTTPAAPKMPVIVETDRGEDFGRVHSVGELAARRKAGVAHGQHANEPMRAVLRTATPSDVTRAERLRSDEDNVRRRAIEKVRTQGLDMKVSDIEWQWDRKRLTIYFTAEKRVDFRQLVRQLEGMFGTRVQMWHIGVRDEARRLDGVGRCGRQLCSASWLPDLRPVKSSIAKDQRLSTLNPAQISGSCGRLMCCLRYEHEFYVQQRKRFPKEGKVLTTALGEEKVVANDIFREHVTLRSLGGDARTIPLAQLNAELGAEILRATSEFAIPGTEEEEPEELFELESFSERIVTSEMPIPEALQPQPRTLHVPPQPPAATAQEPSSDMESPDSESPESGTSASGAPTPDDDARRPRRRRGRRGGRRGRDGGASGGNAPPSSSPPPTT